MTRAKLGVTLLWDQKVGKKSWAANCPLVLEEGLHQLPDFSYLVRVGNLQPQKMSESVLQNKALRSPWKSSKERHERKYISVTEMLAVAAKDSPAMSVNGGAQKLGAALARAQQGTDAHRVFEALKYTDIGTLMQTSEEEFKKPLQFIAQAREVPLLEIIEKGFVEWGFALNHQEALFQGQIDLWGIIDDVLWLVDYKTGSQKYSETAFQQLELYAWALAQMNYTQLVKTIKLAVVYPLDEVVKVREMREPGELNSRIGAEVKSYLSPD
jgi:ATP-dependent helicase/nuclease subunit A